jgi:hypothetical protein
LIAIASKIKQSGGVVVAEQLAPYLDPPDFKLAPRSYDGTAGNYDSYVVRFYVLFFVFLCYFLLLLIVTVTVTVPQSFSDLHFILF